ncbi:MAG: DUF1836 domain-containing protein [Bacilli bacterium]|nr:DUF1836 domain-containing protein [Bacilli bacterium]
MEESKKTLEEWFEEVSSFKLPQYSEIPNVDLYMEQVITYINSSLSVFSDDPKKVLTPFMVNNYVKAGMIKMPKKKKYDKEQIGYLMAITLMKQTLSMADMSLLLDLDQYVTADKGRLYAFYCSIEMNMLREQVKKTKLHLASISSRYENEKKKDPKKARENRDGSLGLLGLRLATEAQACKLLSERILEEIRSDFSQGEAEVIKEAKAKKEGEKAPKKNPKPKKEAKKKAKSGKKEKSRKK